MFKSITKLNFFITILGLTSLTILLSIFSPDGDITKLIVGGFLTTVSSMVNHYFAQNREKAQLENRKVSSDSTQNIVEPQVNVPVEEVINEEDLSNIPH
jgi:hypothetical protein